MTRWIYCIPLSPRVLGNKLNLNYKKSSGTYSTSGMAVNIFWVYGYHSRKRYFQTHQIRALFLRVARSSNNAFMDDTWAPQRLNGCETGYHTFRVGIKVGDLDESILRRW
jgi:hypothetical protein